MKINPTKINNEDFLKGVIAEVVGIHRNRIIPTFSQINTTNLPFYVTVQRLPGTTQGYRTFMSDTEEVEYSQLVESVTFSIQVIGSGSRQWVDRIRASFGLSGIRSQFKKAQIGIISMSQPRDLSLGIDSGFEERTQFEITINQNTLVSAHQNVIKTAEIILKGN